MEESQPSFIAVLEAMRSFTSLAEAATYASRLEVPALDALSPEVRAKLARIYARIDAETPALPTEF